MSVEAMLDELRALVLTVVTDGSIVAARGGRGGFLGFDPDGLVGRNVFEIVDPLDSDDLATYFFENVDESEDTVSLPMPFRLSLVDPHGHPHPVDVIPTGKLVGENDWEWTVLVVPLSLNGSMTRSFDLETGGAPRWEVRRMLCEELRTDNDSYTTRWILVDLSDDDRRVYVARDSDIALREAVRHDIERFGWRPWRSQGPWDIDVIPLGSLPPTTGALMTQWGWRRMAITPVFVRGELSAAFVMVSRIPDGDGGTALKGNVAKRIERLVQTTTLLFERWETQDRLHRDASTDELTGLMNRRALLGELDADDRVGHLLYVDVDGFKAVNDVHGHELGDRVLSIVAERLRSACRPGDVIARIGGDEFVVVLDGADRANADVVAGRIRSQVDEPIVTGSGVLQVSVSVGCSALDDTNPLDTADQEMLSMKRRRRGDAQVPALA